MSGFDHQPSANVSTLPKPSSRFLTPRRCPYYVSHAPARAAASAASAFLWQADIDETCVSKRRRKASSTMIENSTMASSNDGIASRRLPAADDAVLRRAALPGQPSMPLEAEPSSSPAEPFPRLSMSTPTRLLLGSVSSGIVGFTLGAMQGGQTAQLRFRAEHAHKMPDTTTGWYFYHKSKNYHAMQGGIREGFRMAARTGLWSFVALGLESTVDRYRGCSDMFSTTVATLTVAGAFSLWRECFPIFLRDILAARPSRCAPRALSIHPPHTSPRLGSCCEGSMM